MKTKQSQLQVFQRERQFKAPDSSEIAMGPQKFNRESGKNGPGSVATATFFQGASSAVMHKTLSEQWFYTDGPDFYMWLCPEENTIDQGKFYKVTPGSKIEIPPRTKFQIYNPSFELVQVLMVTSPFWPQDETAMDEIAFPEGPWQREDTIEFQADVVAEDYMDKVYNEDIIAQTSSSGFDYIAQALASVDEDIATYSIVGDSWFVFDGDTTFKKMPIPEGALVTPSLSSQAFELLSQEVDKFEVRLQKRKQESIQSFKSGKMCYEAGNYSNAKNYFALARCLGSPDGAYYEGLLHECGEGGQIDIEEALICYKQAANLGHFGAFKQEGKQLYSCGSQEEIWLSMTSDKKDYLEKAERYSSKIKNEGNTLFKAKEYKEALYKFSVGERIQPDNTAFCFNQGLCHKMLGANQEALQMFEKALKLDPKYLKAKYQIELISNGQTQYTEGLLNQWKVEHQKQVDETLKSSDLDVFKREWVYLAPDKSQIRLGPQSFTKKDGTPGFGSVATAMFDPGPSTAVMHNTISEQWFYLDGPDFYFWLCPENKPTKEGQFYLITPGTKLEIPPRHKFQVFNVSNEPVPVLMMEYPFWPQGELANQEIAFPEGPWEVKEPGEFKAKEIASDYMERLYLDDPIARDSQNGCEYIEKALKSIGHDVGNYIIAGEVWSSLKDNEWKTISNTEPAKYMPPLNATELSEMRALFEAEKRNTISLKALVTNNLFGTTQELAPKLFLKETERFSVYEAASTSLPK